MLNLGCNQMLFVRVGMSHADYREVVCLGAAPGKYDLFGLGADRSCDLLPGTLDGLGGHVTMLVFDTRRIREHALSGKVRFLTTRSDRAALLRCDLDRLGAAPARLDSHLRPHAAAGTRRRMSSGDFARTDSVPTPAVNVRAQSAHQFEHLREVLSAMVLPRPSEATRRITPRTHL